MPKALCTSAKLNLGDRVWGEVEKNSFIALPGKRGHSGLLPQKTMCPNPGGFEEEFYSSGSRVGLLIRLECVQGLHSSDLVSGNLDELLWFPASGGFLAAPPLISNCLNLPFGTQERSRRLDSVSYKQENRGQKGLCAQEPHRILLGFSSTLNATMISHLDYYTSL